MLVLDLGVFHRKSHGVSLTESLAWTAVWVVLGVAMIVLPGPAVVVIPAGLAILATEFLWARRAWRRAKGAMARARRGTGLWDRLCRFRRRKKVCRVRAPLGGGDEVA